MTRGGMLVVSLALLHPGMAAAQEDMPEEYAAVLDALQRTGSYADDVLKVDLPRNDLRISVDGVAVPTALGFGGWLAFTRGDEDQDVMMGDLVLTEDEVNAVMTTALDNGIDVTALHNHFFWDTPRMFYLHVHARGELADLARRIAPVAAMVGGTPVGAVAPPPAAPLDLEAIAGAVGHAGVESGQVFKITIGRPDIDLRAHGAPIGSRMGLNTWAAFTGTDRQAIVAGDVAMLADEVTPVLQALRAHGIFVVALHHHMVGTDPDVYFLHYWGRGTALDLAAAVRAALDVIER